MARPQSYSVNVPTTGIALTLEKMQALEILAGSVAVTFQLGDGVDAVSIAANAGYVTPTGVDVPPMKLRLVAASATTVSVIAWYY